MEGQQLEMSTRCLPSRMMRAYSSLTSCAPTAVSCTSAKPRRLRASAITSRERIRKSAMKDGARLHTTCLPAAMASLTRGTSQRTCLAFCGQATKQLPHRMHSSCTISAVLLA